MRPLISVIIPIYKVEPYLKVCLDSVISQTYDNLEIILVDDGSPDNCGKICDEYQEKDERVIVIHKKNGGLSDARNAGLEVCKGEYISFIDSDDYVSPLFIEILYGEIERNNVDISSLCSSDSFKDGTEAKLANELDRMVRSTKVKRDDGLNLLFYQKIPTGVQYRLYKRSIFNNLRFPVGYVYEDLATTYKAFLKANNMVLVKEPLYAYRIRENSIITNKFTQNKMVVKDITKKLYEEINLSHPELKVAAASRCFAANYNVFLQIPFCDKENLNIIWHELNRYNRMVIRDHCKLIRKKNKFGALTTYLGRNISYYVGRAYLRLRYDK